MVSWWVWLAQQKIPPDPHKHTAIATPPDKCLVLIIAVSLATLTEIVVVFKMKGTLAGTDYRQRAVTTGPIIFLKLHPFLYSRQCTLTHMYLMLAIGW